MSAEWKPGDVARIVGDGVHAGQRAMFCNDGIDRRGWAVASTDGTSMAYGRKELRPLAVIDPEDREAVGHFVDIYVSLMGKAGGPVNTMQAALREFAAPKPPRPEEPTGLGAVVEDEDGEKWVGIAGAYGERWVRVGDNDRIRQPYINIAAVCILSPGVEVDQ